MRAALAILCIAVLAYSCTSSAGSSTMAAPPPQALPVVKLNTSSATTYQEFPASLEGTVNVEIRPQVIGYLEKIYVDEGAYVSKGQPLFKINDRVYNEQSSNAIANVQAAQANMEKAQIEVNRLTPLVQGKVISEVQLKAAQSAYDAAKANYAQAKAVKGNADINVGYTLITAPVSGYIGHIPFKTGSLVGRGEAEALTVLSEVNNVYAYFSMSESDFLHFTADIAGKSVEEKLHHIAPVELQLPDNTIYGQKGKIELVQGQFNRTSGTISFRAVFPNNEKLLRSGITGKIRIPSLHQNQMVVPQEATYELQDKVFVFAVADSNKVVSKLINISGKSGNYYLIDKGLNSGETIVYSGLQRLRDGMVIAPQTISMDSILKSNPM
ncbi:MAG: efflux RND transporter periplasmic adaptor subunit [Filimonas sp.]|nr:efflux RND transporter periplasmic adaptor subunit [Filimonas sp.]